MYFVPSFPYTVIARCYEYYHGKDDLPDTCPCIKCFITGEPVVFDIFEPYLKMDLNVKALPLYDYFNNPAGSVHIVKVMAKG